MKYVDHYIDADEAGRVSLEEKHVPDAGEFEAQVYKTLSQTQQAFGAALDDAL